MDTGLNLIKDKSSPIALSIHDTALIPRHCHGDIELIYVLRNEITVRMFDREVHLRPDNILCINSGELHELRGAKPCMFISLRIKTDLLNSMNPDIYKGMYFCCDSSASNTRTKFYLIKHCIAELVKIFTSESKPKPFFNYSIAYLLLNELSMHFMPEMFRPELLVKHVERFFKITSYINDNFSKNLLLSDVASAVGLQPQYVSMLFKRHFNMNFLSFYNEIRLSHGVNKLLASNKTIEEIAGECGFSEGRTFALNFKKRYKMSPSKYRKAAQAQETSTDIKKEDYLSLLAKYLPPLWDANIENIGIVTEIKYVQIQADVALEAGLSVPSYKDNIVLASAREALYADIQELLKTAQDEIGFENLCFNVGDAQAVQDKAARFAASIGLKAAVLPEPLDEGPANLIHDTCLQPCVEFKQLFENANGNQRYWRLIDQESGGSAPFAGERGLFTVGGVKKPLYNALRLLGRLKGGVIAKGEGHVMSASPGKIHLLLYNYEHMAERFFVARAIDESFMERLKQVKNLSRLNAEIVIKNISVKVCVIHEYILNREHGSSFDAWIEMGAPDVTDPNTGLLKKICEPKVVFHREEAKDGILTLDALLEPLEIRVIEIEAAP